MFQVLNLDIFINDLPNFYSITDKADGDRAYLILHDENMYILFNNLYVKKIKSDMNKKTKLNNLKLVILDR